VIQITTKKLFITTFETKTDFLLSLLQKYIHVYEYT